MTKPRRHPEPESKSFFAWDENPVMGRYLAGFMVQYLDKPIVVEVNGVDVRVKDVVYDQKADVLRIELEKDDE